MGGNVNDSEESAAQGRRRHVTVTSTSCDVCLPLWERPPPPTTSCAAGSGWAHPPGLALPWALICRVSWHCFMKGLSPSAKGVPALMLPSVLKRGDSAPTTEAQAPHRPFDRAGIELVLGPRQIFKPRSRWNGCIQLRLPEW